MKFRITYRVGGMPFTAEANNIAEAYDYIRAIVTSNKTVFPNPEDSLSDYMLCLARIKCGELICTASHVITVEAVQDEPST